MKYISTRGGIDKIDFTEAVMMGLARDGGLLLPEELPVISPDTRSKWAGLSYTDLAFEVMSIFVSDISRDVFKDLIAKSYRYFDSSEITPIVKLNDIYLLELFHGPTLAFKDIALQYLGNLFEYLLSESGSTMNILGATSGDTGSAAIYGVKGKDNINIFILHPHGRVSPVQALQMTTVQEDNVFNLAIEGTFDDCQAIVKAIFGELDFRDKYRLGAVNSINWARVLAQVVYYVYAYFKVTGPSSDKVVFSVPTGNFGDIFAGYVARHLLGEGIDKLILATNENNILTRFVCNGEYKLGEVVSTISPSMDIQVASNFERYLYYLYGCDPQRVRETMLNFAKTGAIDFPKEYQEKARQDFMSVSTSQEETLETIARVFNETGYIVDPHTAVGISAAKKLSKYIEGLPVVCLATAHPAKFPDAVKRAIGRGPDLPPVLKDLDGLTPRVTVLPADVNAVKDYISDKVTR